MWEEAEDVRLREQAETWEPWCEKNGKLPKEGKGKGVLEAAGHQRFLTPSCCTGGQAQTRETREIFINGWCWWLWREVGTAPSEPLADRLCTLGESVGKKGRTAPHLGEDSSGKSGCFSSILWKATAASKLLWGSG